MSRGRLAILQEAYLSEILVAWGGFPPMARFWALLDIVDNDQLYEVVYAIITDSEAPEGTIASVFHDLEGLARDDDHFLPKNKMIVEACGL